MPLSHHTIQSHDLSRLNFFEFFFSQLLVLLSAPILLADLASAILFHKSKTTPVIFMQVWIEYVFLYAVIKSKIETQISTCEFLSKQSLE